MDNDTESVAGQMNRDLYLAPDLIGEGEDDPLVEHAEDNVDDDVERNEQRDEARKKRD